MKRHPNTIHGLTKRTPDGGRIDSPEWRIYNAMKNRCLNKNSSRFMDYGGRGVTICERWLYGDENKSGVECFIEDMGPRPSSKHSLNRIDNNEGYSLENCEWASAVQQARNHRRNRIVTIKGKRMVLADAVEKYATAKYGTVVMRLYRGWDDERAILTP